MVDGLVQNMCNSFYTVCANYRHSCNGNFLFKRSLHFTYAMSCSCLDNAIT
jgi:hypothetical protein